MKALVLCAGRGTRLRPLTHTRAKAALPIAGRPVLGHILAYLKTQGFTEIGIVISPEQAELKRLHMAEEGQHLTYIVQRRPRGIAHAVLTAKRFLGNEPFLLYLGDNLTHENISQALERFDRNQSEALIAVREVPNPQAFGVAEVDGDRVIRVVEKPSRPATNLAIAGLYLFRPSVLEVIHELRPSARGEYEITDAIAAMVEAGHTVEVHRMSSWWQDMGTPEGMLLANGLLLDGMASDIAPSVSLATTQVQGRVVILPGAVLQNVRLRGPLMIGSGCHIKDAYIGPYTSVGEGVHIQDASVENSILLPDCRLCGIPFHLEDCLLGRGAVVEVKSGRTFTILVGDDGRLQIPPDRR